MLKLKKTAVAAVLGVGCVATAQAWYEGSLGTLSSDNELVSQNAFGLFSSPLVSANTNILDWYTFSVAPGVSSATGALTASFASLSFDFGFDSLTFSVYEGTYTDRLNLLVDADVLKVAFPNLWGLQSVGSFDLQSDGTLNGTFNFNPAVSDYTLVISGVAAGVSFFGTSEYAFTLSAVPEPAEYAMLLAGLGIVGMVSRRRKAK
ncbi:MAG: FxDxF family PEP-CTERM protein [Betaproteobacteria bacterium]|nr:FxDxF family PEP-CTERM protein [Betaproteobacteria bacterium]